MPAAPDAGAGVTAGATSPPGITPDPEPAPKATRPGRLGANFYRLLTASAAANVADGVFQVALPLLAAVLTRSPLLIAAVTFAYRLPWLLVALPAGALADRLDRRRTMFLVQVGRTLLLGGLGVLIALDLTSIWLLAVAAFLLGVGETLFDTAAQSILPAVVRREQLSTANGRLNAAEWTANLFIGPPLGGLIAGIATAGIALAFGTSAALFGVAGILLLWLRGSFRPERPPGEARPRLLADVIEGARYLASHRLLATLAFMTGAMNLAFTGIFSVFVLFATGPGSAMGLSEAGYGLLLTGLGAGAILGGVIAAPLERLLGRTNLLLAAVLLGSLQLLVPLVTVNPFAIAASFAVGSAFSVCWNVVTVSLRQRIAPDHLLGRVNAGYRLLAWGSMPLGAALGGLVADAFGLRATFAAGAVLVLALLSLRPFVSETKIAAAEARAEPTSSRTPKGTA